MATITVSDSSGNRTRTQVSAPHLSANLDTNGYRAAIRPYSPYTVSLLRSGGVIASVSGNSSSDGVAQGVFADQTYSPGDQIALASGDLSFTVEVVPLDIALDPAANQLAGDTSSNVKVRAAFSHTRDNYLVNTCASQSTCAAGVSNGSGQLQLSAGMDTLPGNSALVTLFDAQGNSQFTLRHAPVLVIDTVPNYPAFNGYWNKPGTRLEMRLRSGSVVNGPWLRTVNPDGSYFFPLHGNQVETVEITDPATGETISAVFPSGGAELSDVTEHFTAWAPATQRAVALVNDYRPASNVTVVGCKEAVPTNEHYDLDFSELELGGGDTAEAFHSLSSGNYVHGYTHAFRVWLRIEKGIVTGYTVFSDEEITVTLRDGSGAVLTTRTWQSRHSDGYYSFGVGSPLLPGQQVEVSTEKGSQATLTVPELTMIPDGPGNSYHGTAPASSRLNLALEEISGGVWVQRSIQGRADEHGDYTIPLAGMFIDFGGCRFASAGNPCNATTITSYLQGEHQASLYTDVQTLPPDSYEPDDTFDTAKLYEPFSSRNLAQTSSPRLPDTIRFEVLPDQVGKILHLATVNLGPTADTDMWLYELNDQQPILLAAAVNRPRVSAQMDWTPEKPGTYYIQVNQLDRGYPVASCGLTYSLLIYSDQIYLPVVTR